MADVYQAFLRSPSAAHLAQDASLHYITTTTSINQPDAIIKHLQTQEKQVEKKGENILSCIESSNGVCLETETTFKFARGGGVLLPQMDDNMLFDMEAVCTMIHIVQLDANRKISQIRLHWDQGSMLKQVEAIGRTGRNWPIRAGQDQAKLVSQSVKSSGQSQAIPAASNGNGSSSVDQSQTSSSATKKQQQLPLNSIANVGRRHDENDSHFDMAKDAPPPATGNHQHFAVDGMTTSNVSRRHDENDNHFNNNDTSPDATENTDPNKAARGKPAKRSDQVSSWNFSDMQETPIKEAKIYKTYGDGMGGRAGSRLWDVASDDAPQQYGGKGGEKQVYKTAGNGMGGRKGTGLSWSIGDEFEDA